jgi:hypothetical protein
MADMNSGQAGSSCTSAAVNTPCELPSGGLGSCWNSMCVGKHHVLKIGLLLLLLLLLLLT